MLSARLNVKDVHLMEVKEMNSLQKEQQVVLFFQFGSRGVTSVSGNDQ